MINFILICVLAVISFLNGEQNIFSYICVTLAFKLTVFDMWDARKKLRKEAYKRAIIVPKTEQLEIMEEEHKRSKSDLYKSFILVLAFFICYWSFMSGNQNRQNKIILEKSTNGYKAYLKPSDKEKIVEFTSLGADSINFVVIKNIYEKLSNK